MNTRELRTHLADGKAALFTLNERAKFRLSGADRVRYLNGQVSNDIRKVKAGEAHPACVMTAKGKMNALIWVAAGADALRIDTDGALREELAARLERYIISDDAVLEDVTDETGLLHLISGGEGVAGFTLLDLAAGIAARCDGAELALDRSRRFHKDGVDVYGPVASITAFAAAWAAEQGIIVDDATAEVFRIEQGIPRWGAELTENTIPVEAGLETIAIDYHKGCYIGQEIISRIKSVGHVNRTLSGFIADEALPVGTLLKAGEKDVGIITSAAWSFALEKGVALGYLRRGSDPAQITPHGAGVAEGARIEARALPLI